MKDSVSGAGTADSISVARQYSEPVFLTLIVLILAVPLPFGAYPDWAWAGMAAVSGVLLFCWGFSALGGRVSPAAPPGFLLLSAAFLGLAMLWGLLQTAEFMPESWHHPIWREAAAALDTTPVGAISLDPAAGRGSVLRVAAYAGIFWLAFQYGRNSHRAGCALRAIAAGCACYALYGLGVVFSGADSILWFQKTDYTDAVTATFVNPNSFGTYCGIGLLCATAVLARRFSRRLGGRTGFRERLRFWIVEFMPRSSLLLSAWLVLAGALLLSLSRGATAATALSLLALLAVLALRHGFSFGRLLSWLAGATLTGILLLLLAGEPLERRLWDTGPDFAKRSEIYSQTILAIREQPLLGTGLGTFGAVYRGHRTEDIRPGVLMAHNDYLELALELGIPAAALFVTAILVLAGGCARGVWIRRRDFEFPAVGAAVCVLVGAHSAVDFSLQIPAVAATFSFVLGVAVAQAVPTGGGGGSIATWIRKKPKAAATCRCRGMRARARSRSAFSRTREIETADFHT